MAVPGVAQSQVSPTAGLDLATGLRFLMRQDPEVIMVGEIRDRPTAEAALQASLDRPLALEHLPRRQRGGNHRPAVGYGHRALRPAQRPAGDPLATPAAPACTCARTSDDPALRLGLPVTKVSAPVGCAACGGTGYRGRFLLAEMLALKSPAAADAATAAALGRDSPAGDTAEIQRLSVAAGMVDRWRPRAYQAVEEGRTSPAEVRRVLGFVR